jgi:peptidoglycan/xylan/chitin deacetylase (PgdA/CDA1 family)
MLPRMDPRATERASPVSILVYHAVTDTPGSHVAPFTVSPADFHRHLDLIAERGLRCVTFSELLELESREGAAPAGTVVLTFDDGYADFADNVAPALSARALASTLYLTTGWLEGAGPREPGPSDRMLSMDQLPDLLAAGVELGAHSHSHPHMDTLPPAPLRDELRRPKQMLEDALGQPVTTFAYPHGYNGPRVRRATQEAGYANAAAVRDALHGAGEDRFAVSRLMLTNSTTPAAVAAWLDGRGPVSASGAESWPTRGWRAYRRGRAIASRTPVNVYR